MNATGIVVPARIVDALNAGKKPVTVTINVAYSYRGRIASLGGDYTIGVAKEHRDKAGIKACDLIDLETALDEAPRKVVIPPDLAKALAKKEGRESRVREAFLYSARRGGAPKSKAGAALFLASPASRHVNGASIVIEGGFSFGIAD